MHTCEGAGENYSVQMFVLFCTRYVMFTQHNKHNENDTTQTIKCTSYFIPSTSSYAAPGTKFFHTQQKLNNRNHKNTHLERNPSWNTFVKQSTQHAACIHPCTHNMPCTKYMCTSTHAILCHVRKSGTYIHCIITVLYDFYACGKTHATKKRRFPCMYFVCIYIYIWQHTRKKKKIPPATGAWSPAATSGPRGSRFRLARTSCVPTPPANQRRGSMYRKRGRKKAHKHIIYI